MKTLDAAQILKAAQGVQARVCAIRRDIHAHPELGLETPRTQELILAELSKIGVEGAQRGKKCTSVVAEIHGKAGAPGRVRVLRADMDALPMTERADVAFKSTHPDRMHACGHDAHVAMLLGAARVLHENRSKFSGTVRLLFQPGEEGFGGAKLMIDEGVLDGVESAFAIHLEPGRDPGLVALRAGAMLAAFDNFEVVFHGRGGHASSPFRGRDPIPAIGAFVDALSHVSARDTDPNDRVVFSVTTLSAGTTHNVVPADARCGGTVRTLSEKGREAAERRLKRAAAGVAATRGLDVDVEIEAGYPPTLNAEAVVDDTFARAAELGLPVEKMVAPFMGAEDFSYVLQRVPGAISFLGCRVPDGGPLHSDLMKIDENALADGVALHVAMATR